MNKFTLYKRKLVSDSYVLLSVKAVFLLDLAPLCSSLCVWGLGQVCLCFTPNICFVWRVMGEPVALSIVFNCFLLSWQKMKFHFGPLVPLFAVMVLSTRFRCFFGSLCGLQIWWNQLDLIILVGLSFLIFCKIPCFYNAHTVLQFIINYLVLIKKNWKSKANHIVANYILYINVYL